MIHRLIAVVLLVFYFPLAGVANELEPYEVIDISSEERTCSDLEASY